MLKFCVEWTADFFYVHAEVEYGHLGNVRRDTQIIDIWMNNLDTIW